VCKEYIRRIIWPSKTTKSAGLTSVSITKAGISDTESGCLRSADSMMKNYDNGSGTTRVGYIVWIVEKTTLLAFNFTIVIDLRRALLLVVLSEEENTYLSKS
jgi:hypothetical protein